MSTHTFADVAIPSPAAIVLQAGSIAVGKLEIAGTDAYLSVAATLKGTPIDGRRLLLVDATKTVDFDLVGLAKTRKNDPVITLGDLDSTAGTFSLRWIHASVWPPSPKFDTFPSDRFDDCRAFVSTVLGYEQMGAKDAVQLANTLVQDVDGTKVYAALDFTDVAWLAHAKSAGADLGRLVPWAMYAKIGAKTKDAYLERQIVSMVSLLPASVAIPHLLRIATAAGANSKSARSRVESLLKAKGLTKGKKLSVNELEAIFQANRSSLQRQDAQIALRMFDSQATAVCASADRTLEAILGAPLPGDGATRSIAVRRSLWAKEIEKLPS